MPETNLIDKGQLRISAVSEQGNVPIDNATIEISFTGEPDQILEQITTDNSGNSDTVELGAPPVEYSLEPGDNQPYSEYNLKITAPGFEEVEISGIQILSGQLGLSNVRMTPVVTQTPAYNPLVIGAHTLWKLYPPKIAEAEIKDIDETGEIVLSRVVIPETIIVHDGPPTDSSAANYFVPFRDYIKNVASSEIYATWPETTIIANILAILSFTLNRVYTEWYRNKGYDFTITSSTAYDHFLSMDEMSMRASPESWIRFSPISYPDQMYDSRFLPNTATANGSAARTGCPSGAPKHLETRGTRRWKLSAIIMEMICTSIPLNKSAASHRHGPEPI